MKKSRLTKLILFSFAALLLPLSPAIAHSGHHDYGHPSETAAHLMIHHGGSAIIAVAFVAVIFWAIRRWGGMLAIAICLLAAASLTPGPAAAQQDQKAQVTTDSSATTKLSREELLLIADGEKIAKQKCARCHAIAYEKSSPNPEAPKFRDFQREWPAGALEESLAEGIVTGHPEMPEFKFAPPQIAAFVAYLNTLRTTE